MDWIEKQIIFPSEKNVIEDDKAKTVDSLSVTCEDGLDYHYLSEDSTSLKKVYYAKA